MGIFGRMEQSTTTIIRWIFIYITLARIFLWKVDQMKLYSMENEWFCESRLMVWVKLMTNTITNNTFPFESLQPPHIASSMHTFMEIQLKIHGNNE